MTLRLAAALALLASTSAAPALAAASVVGTGYARACYEAAEQKRPTRLALKVCDSALMDETLDLADRARTYVNRGIIHMQARNLNAAIADYDAAIRVAPDTAEAYVNKGLAMLRLGRHEDVVTLLTEGLVRNPVRPEVAYFSRGMAYEILGQKWEAYHDYVRAVELAPDWREPAEELSRFKIIPKKKTAGV